MTGNKVKAIICWIFSGIIALSLLAGIITAYFIRFTNGDGEVTDGFGRILIESPGVVSYVLKHWAGSVWFGIDCFILIAGMIAANILLNLGKDKYNNVYRDYENNFF